MAQMDNNLGKVKDYLDNLKPYATITIEPNDEKSYFWYKEKVKTVINSYDNPKTYELFRNLRVAYLDNCSQTHYGYILRLEIDSKDEWKKLLKEIGRGPFGEVQNHMSCFDKAIEEIEEFNK